MREFRIVVVKGYSFGSSPEEVVYKLCEIKNGKIGKCYAVITGCDIGWEGHLRAAIDRPKLAMEIRSEEILTEL